MKSNRLTNLNLCLCLMLSALFSGCASSTTHQEEPVAMVAADQSPESSVSTHARGTGSGVAQKAGRFARNGAYFGARAGLEIPLRMPLLIPAIPILVPLGAISGALVGGTVGAVSGALQSRQ